MGLDNGIIVKRTEATTDLKELQPYAFSGDTERKYSFELCYWRKCWNVREIFFNIIGYFDQYKTELSEKDLKLIYKALKSLNHKTWDESRSVWTWKEHKRSHKRNLKALKKLIKLKHKYPNIIEAYFYDSY